jgi:hypothetical protein
MAIDAGFADDGNGPETLLKREAEVPVKRPSEEHEYRRTLSPLAKISGD